MEIWTWFNQRNAIWIHTHEPVITLYNSIPDTLGIGVRHEAESMMEKWNVIQNILDAQDTIVLLYSGIHFTTIIRDANNRPTRRQRTEETYRAGPPTQRERPAKVKTTKRKRKRDDEATQANAPSRCSLYNPERAPGL